MFFEYVARVLCGKKSKIGAVFADVPALLLIHVSIELEEKPAHFSHRKEFFA
jgi:hypothetical protein